MYNLHIEVNGEEVRLTDFPSKIISNTILAMLQSLQDVDEVKEVKVEITKEE